MPQELLPPFEVFAHAKLRIEAERTLELLPSSPESPGTYRKVKFTGVLPAFIDDGREARDIKHVRIWQVCRDMFHQRIASRTGLFPCDNLQASQLVGILLSPSACTW